MQLATYRWDSQLVPETACSLGEEGWPNCPLTFHVQAGTAGPPDLGL